MAISDSVIKNHADFIWSVADLLRGDYKRSEYQKVILPLTVLRRLDCVLEPTKKAVIGRAEKLKGRIENVEDVLCQVSGEQFYNVNPLDFGRLRDDTMSQNQIAGNLRSYIAGFSSAARDIIDKFDFDVQITRLARADLLYLVLSRFAEIDLHPETVSNVEMGYLYEELIRKFSELSNETAGEHFTPREIIRLMVNLLFIEDDAALAKAGTIKTLFDPACGTGGMLSVADDHIRALNPATRLEVFGQELNAETYAVCRSDLMVKGQNAANIVLGNSFTEDGFLGQTFDYMLANPPFGVEWKRVEDHIRREYEKEGFGGRFGAGLPRINDGSFLFLQHMLSKMRPADQGGSRLAIVFNGSPLFTGAAGSGESEIRRWIIENDWLEAVVSLPDQLFYNTGISTYFWVLTNRKSPERRGRVQLVDAREFWVKMPKSLGDKRKEISPDQIEEVTRLYGEFTEGEKVKVFPNEAFGYQRITVERPLRLRWEVTEGTVGAIRATKAYGVLEDYELETDPDKTWAAPLERALEQVRGSSFTTPDELDLQLGKAILGAWQQLGEDPFDTPPDIRPGLTAKALDLTPAQARQIFDALAVRDPEAEPITDTTGKARPDPELRDAENVPFPPVGVTWELGVQDRLSTVEYRRAVADYMATEVIPYLPEAWVDHEKTKIGYEIPLTRHFYRYVPPRPLSEIDLQIAALETEIQSLLREVTE